MICVPGNHDPYDIIDAFEEYDVNLHGKVRKVCGETFAGWGGALSPFNLAFEPTEEETKAGLEEMARKIGKDFILILHNPPKDTKLDRIISGEHVGSPAEREFIENTQPKLVITAHIHEASGEDRIGKSVLFYPGPFYAGRYGVVTVEGDKIKCEIKKIVLGRD